MKKIIISATLILSTGIILTSCIKHHDATQAISFPYNYTYPFSAKQDIGSAD